MTGIEVKSKIELSKFRKHWMNKFFKRRTTVLFYVLISLLNVIALIGKIPPFLAFFGLLGGLLLPLFILFKIRKMFKSNPFFREEISYLFKEEDLTISYQDRQDSYKYTDLHKVEKGEDFVLVYLSQLIAFYIDVDAFNIADPKEIIPGHLSNLEGVNYTFV